MFLSRQLGISLKGKYLKCNRLRDINKWWVGVRGTFPLFLSSSGYNVCHTKVVTPS